VAGAYTLRAIPSATPFTGASTTAAALNERQPRSPPWARAYHSESRSAPEIHRASNAPTGVRSGRPVRANRCPNPAA
jgi:hypothetical protein